MNGPTHRSVTKLAIDLLYQEGAFDFRIQNKTLKDAKDEIATANSDTDNMKDLEFVDVDGDRDDPHVSSWKDIDDVARYKTSGSGGIGEILESVFDYNMELTSFNHFIDIRKGTGIYDDYDGYSCKYGSACINEHEKKVGQYVDSFIAYWFNDEYIHVPGEKWYRNCSPSVWRYIFPKGSGSYVSKKNQILERFPIAESKGKKNKGFPWSVTTPVDNLGRFWYESFLLSGKWTDLGPTLHAVQDASIPHHAAGCCGNYHADYEKKLQNFEERLNEKSQSARLEQFKKEVCSLYRDWNRFSGKDVSGLVYGLDKGKTPEGSWRIDYLITWMAFQAYEQYETTYEGFKKNSFDESKAWILLKYATAMTMLVLSKAKKEYQECIPSREQKINTLTVYMETSDKKNAKTKNNLAVYIYNHFCGGEIRLELPNSLKRTVNGVDVFSCTYDVSQYNVNADTFRIGISKDGNDDWLPSKINITYKIATGETRQYNYGDAWDIWFNDELSRQEVSKRPHIGKDDTQVGKIALTCTTTNRTFANTTSRIYLLLQQTEEDTPRKLPFKKTSIRRNSTIQEEFNVQPHGMRLRDLKIAVHNSGVDSWNPKSFSLKVYDLKGEEIVNKEIKLPNNTWLGAFIRKNKYWIYDNAEENQR